MIPFDFLFHQLGSFYNNTHNLIIISFNPPTSGEQFPDLEINFLTKSSVIKTGFYFIFSGLINRLSPYFTSYKLLGALVQLLLQTLPTFLYLTNININGIEALVYNHLPQTMRPYIISTSHGNMPELNFSFSTILLFVLAVTLFCTLALSFLLYLISFLFFKNKSPVDKDNTENISSSHSQTVILNNISKFKQLSNSLDSTFNLLAFTQAHFLAYPFEFNSDSQKVIYLAKQLEGPMRSWFCESSVRDPSILESYNCFVSKLLAHTAKEGTKEESATTPNTCFSSCTQGMGSLADYNKRFQEIQSQLKATHTEACDFYMLGLNSDLKAFLIYHNLPEELELLIKTVSKWERKFQTISKPSQPQPVLSTNQPTTRSTTNPRPFSSVNPTNTSPVLAYKPKEGSGYCLTAAKALRRRLNKLCSYCGQGDHLVANCPDPQRIPCSNSQTELTLERTTTDLTGPSNQTQVNNLQTPGKSSLPFIQIVIHGPDSSIETFALLDTGANVNYIDSRLVKALKFLPGSKIDARGPNNLPVTAFKIKPPILFRLGKSAFHSQFVSSKSLNFPVYLGMNWCEEVGLTVRCQERKVDFHTHDIPCSLDLLRKQQLPISFWNFKMLNSCTILPPAEAALSNNNIPLCISDYEEVFSDKQCRNLPPHRPYDIQINLTEGANPPWGRIIPLSDADNKMLLEYINNVLSKGFITRSTSPCSLPIFFVAKSDGSKQPYIDYCALNAVTIKDCCPIPSAEALTDCLLGSQVFSKVDLCAAFNQICVAKGHEWKTAFCTPFGLYKYKVMPFGLCNTPSMFQALMNKVLLPFLNEFVVVYLDNILIYSKNYSNHVDHLRKVMARLQEYHLYCKLSKCCFFQTSVEFLGYIVTKEGFAIAPSKLNAILLWPVPKNCKELCGFLGLANYCCKFFPGFSSIVLPLTNLTSTKVEFKWSAEAQDPFERIRHLFATPPVLLMPDSNKPFFLETDTSNYAVGAVLLQHGGMVCSIL
ncbi:hypothetical protein DSO57_1039620 [Entomophthora muscae]|uniref:Uncharacterized protein n=1 Tax=Entomophthora muscae TaxID=34485 RepID=A0ACC2UMN4_9FUNG|nr:hypothetical protein DSO57_1039620 [Entomophthora muscae]